MEALSPAKICMTCPHRQPRGGRGGRPCRAAAGTASLISCMNLHLDQSTESNINSVADLMPPAVGTCSGLVLLSCLRPDGACASDAGRCRIPESAPNRVRACHLYDCVPA